MGEPVSATASAIDGREVATTLDRLAQDGAATLATLPRDALAAAWQATVDAFRRPATSSTRDPRLALRRTSALSAAGLEAALTCVLDGVSGAHAEAVFETRRRARGGTPGAIILASNIPGLAVQPLLPALAVGRPVLIKSASEEPRFAPAFVDLLCHNEPRLRAAIATLTWPGGVTSIEAPLLARAAPIVAYGDNRTMADLAARAGDRLVPFGAKLSLAVLDGASDLDATGLARDIALFDQQGCLSIQAIYLLGTLTDARRLAQALAAALVVRADEWPMGAIETGLAVAVQHWRAEADLRGLFRPPLALEIGTVIVDQDATLRPSPGLRSVRIHPLDSLASLPPLLHPWRGRLQGVARTGRARRLDPLLGRLGVSRCASPGRLQAAGTGWRNGEVDLTEIFASG